MFSAGKRSHYLAFMGVPPSCPNNRNGNEILDETVNEKLNEDLRSICLSERKIEGKFSFRTKN